MPCLEFSFPCPSISLFATPLGIGNDRRKKKQEKSPLFSATHSSLLFLHRCCFLFFGEEGKREGVPDIERGGDEPTFALLLLFFPRSAAAAEEKNRCCQFSVFLLASSTSSFEQSRFFSRGRRGKGEGYQKGDIFFPFLPFCNW